MRRSLGTLVALLALATLAALVGVAPALAHDVNHLSADPQVSANGTVVLESAYATEDGFVVLYRDWDGRSGERVGVTEFSAARVDVTEVPVSVDEAAWADIETNATLTAVLYADADEDGEFDPETDPPQVSFGRPTQATFDVARGEGAVYVSAAALGAQPSSGTVGIRAVSLAEPGHLVVSLSEDGEPTRTLGHVSLSAGTHRDVQVPLSRSFLASRNETFTVFATAYTDDGDGEFDADDRPVRANVSLVTTRFSVDPRVGTGTPTAVVNTPTATGTTTATPTATGTTETGTETGTGTDTAGDGPGFGVTVAAVALAGGMLTLVIRGRGEPGR